MGISIHRINIKKLLHYFYKVLPAVYNIDNNLFIPLLFGCGACVISWVCSMVLGYIDYKAGFFKKNQFYYLILINNN